MLNTNSNNMSIELAFTIFFFGCLVILAVFLMAIWYDNRKPKHPNRCDCKDVNQCEKWCIGKINYTKSQNNYSISEECKHPNLITEVLESSATCETTVEKCADCHQPLSNPKTDCR